MLVLNGESFLSLVSLKLLNQRHVALQRSSRGINAVPKSSIEETGLQDEVKARKCPTQGIYCLHN